ncbi:MAG: MarR family transcriptional regulator, partial [candidate division WOR-3 bacterium]
MSKDQKKACVEKIRRFNRFYTRQIGLLTQGLLKTRFPLTQARIIFELAQHGQSTAKDIINELDIDPAYLSRILSAFQKQDLIRKVRSKSDNRQWLVELTAEGKKAFAVLDNRASDEVRALLMQLPGEDRQRLVRAMQTIEKILTAKSEATTVFLLRSQKPGDIGWMIYRHGALYAEEYGFDETFETLVAEILTRFMDHHDPKRERIWIAEEDGQPVGSVMVADAGNSEAQLRLLLVEPRSRGKGLGKRLIDECVNFSIHAGYKRIRLWTQSILVEARHLYQKAGFAI